MRTSARSRRALGLAAAAAACFTAHAAETPPMRDAQRLLSATAPSSLFVQAGQAKDTTTFTLGALREWRSAWPLGAHGRVSGYSEISLGQWRANREGGTALVTQVGFTPTLRYWLSEQPVGWFGEVAVGANLLTPVYRTREKHFSTAFNFGDHVALGFRERGSRGLEWSLRLQHYSNAGIRQPNPGENFVQFRVAVPLRAGAHD